MEHLFRKTASILAAILVAVTAIILPADMSAKDSDGTVLIKGDPEKGKPINRAPSSGSVIVAYYIGHTLSLPDSAVCAEVTVADSGGNIILYGAFDAATLRDGIVIGSLDCFTVTLVTDDGTTYTGTFNI